MQIMSFFTLPKSECVQLPRGFLHLLLLTPTFSYQADRQLPLEPTPASPCELLRKGVLKLFFGVVFKGCS